MNFCDLNGIGFEVGKNLKAGMVFEFEEAGVASASNPALVSGSVFLLGLGAPRILGLGVRVFKDLRGSGKGLLFLSFWIWDLGFTFLGFAGLFWESSVKSLGVVSLALGAPGLGV